MADVTEALPTVGDLHKAGDAVRDAVVALREATAAARKLGLEIEFGFTQDGDIHIKRMGYDL